jgi:hypothetical protein
VGADPSPDIGLLLSLSEFFLFESHGLISLSSAGNGALILLDRILTLIEVAPRLLVMVKLFGKTNLVGIDISTMDVVSIFIL